MTSLGRDDSQSHPRIVPPSLPSPPRGEGGGERTLISEKRYDPLPAALAALAGLIALAVLTAAPDPARFSPPAAPAGLTLPAPWSPLASDESGAMLRARYEAQESAERRAGWRWWLQREVPPHLALYAGGLRTEYLRALWRRGEQAFALAEVRRLLALDPDADEPALRAGVRAATEVMEAETLTTLTALLARLVRPSLLMQEVALTLETLTGEPFPIPPERLNLSHRDGCERWRRAWLERTAALGPWRFDAAARRFLPAADAETSDAR